MVACECNHPEIVRWLLEEEYSLSYWQDEAFIAVRAGAKEVLEVLFEYGVDVDTDLKHGGNLLDEAAADGQVEIVKLLIARGAYLEGYFGHDPTRVGKQGEGYNSSPLQFAAQYGHEKIVEVLVEAGAKLYGQSADFYREEARRSKRRLLQQNLQEALSEGEEEKVRHLLENGADANFIDAGGNTLLAQWLEKEKFSDKTYPAAKVLIGHTDLSWRNANGETYWDIGCRMRDVHVLDSLIDRPHLSPSEVEQLEQKSRNEIQKYEEELEALYGTKEEAKELLKLIKSLNKGSQRKKTMRPKEKNSG